MYTSSITGPHVDDPRDTAPRKVGAVRRKVFTWLLDEVLPSGNSMLDLGAGPCVFARLAAAQGYVVTAVDGRVDRVPTDLPPGVSFTHADVRTYPNVSGWDVVSVLGLLYHLTLDDQRSLLGRIDGSAVIIETQIHDPANYPRGTGDWARRPVTTEDGFEGVSFPEGTGLAASIGNPESFWHTEPSILRLFDEAGYSKCRIIDPLFVSQIGARKFYLLER